MGSGRVACGSRRLSPPRRRPLVPPVLAAAVVAVKVVQWTARWWVECTTGVRARRKELQRRMQAASSHEAWAEAAQEVGA